MVSNEDFRAIDVYIKSAPLYTSEARSIRDEWTVWYDSISWPTQENYDHARNLRNEFNLANARTAAESAQAERVIQTGMTTEEMAGGTRRSLLSGMYDEPIVSMATKAVAIFAAIGAGAALIAWQIGSLESKVLDKLAGR